MIFAVVAIISYRIVIDCVSVVVIIVVVWWNGTVATAVLLVSSKSTVTAVFVFFSRTWRAG